MAFYFFEIFGRKSKLKLEREIYITSIIKQEIAIFDERLNDLSSNHYNIMEKYVDKSNSICPSCKSENVNDRIQQVEGQINGSISGSNNSFLGFGSGSINGSIHGTIDTKEINKCNDCGNEWKKSKPFNKYTSGYRYDVLKRLIYYLEAFYKYKNCKYDPTDVKDKYNSLDEKRTGLLKEYLNFRYADQMKVMFHGISIDTLMYLVNEYCYSWSKDDFKHYYNEQLLIEIGLRIIK